MPNGDESRVVDDTNGSNDQTQDKQASTQANVSEADAAEVTRIAELEAELDKARNNLQAARRFEKESKLTRAELEAQLRDQGKFKELYEQAATQLKNIALDGALAEAAKAAKAKDVKAVLKLVDRSSIEVKNGIADAKSVESAVLKAKEEFSILFDHVETPAPKRAAEGAVTSGFEKELDACKSAADIQAVMRKYGKTR
jgi:hypothetical protein